MNGLAAFVCRFFTVIVSLNDFLRSYQTLMTIALQQLYQRLRRHWDSMAAAILLQQAPVGRRVQSSLCRHWVFAHALLGHLCALPNCRRWTEIHFRRRAGRTAQVGVGFLVLLHISVAHFCYLFMPQKLQFVVENTLFLPPSI